MGRSYWFECSRCGYRAKVSGQADRGVDFSVQTIVCLDCKTLYDAVTRARLSAQSAGTLGLKNGGTPRLRAPEHRQPPAFQAMLGRLPASGLDQFKWVQFKPRCPVAAHHKVEIWNNPSKCPRCGLHLERNALPFRVWE